MIKPSVARSKARKGLALNLSELAIASGYHRDQLSKMLLPLEAGKISLQDFQRIMRKRQDYRERLVRNAINCRASVSDAKSSKPRDAIVSFQSANGDQKREAAGMFYGPSSKSAGKGASRRAQQFQLQGTA
jgi:hypothetical protein